MKQIPENQLSAAKIAIVGPSFFGYLETLQEGFRARGIATQFYDERRSNSVMSKIALRFLPKALSSLQARKHHSKIFADIVAQGTTHVLVISSEFFPVELLESMQTKGIQIIAYCFDSFANKPHMRKITAISDAAASFDPADCEETSMTYIPLYSNLQPEMNITPFKERTIDFLYFGTLHSNRPYWIARAKTICEDHGWNGRFLLFFHNKVLWYMRFMSTPPVLKLGEILSTEPFPSSTLNKATLNSKVVIDIHHPGQTGLTMRIFEALSCGSVVISTNPGVETTLPKEIAEKRVRSVNAENMPAVMQEALEMNPPELSPEEVYFLSAERYLDQICTLIVQANNDETTTKRGL